MRQRIVGGGAAVGVCILAVSGPFVLGGHGCRGGGPMCDWGLGVFERAEEQLRFRAFGRGGRSEWGLRALINERGGRGAEETWGRGVSDENGWDCWQNPI